VMVMPSGLTSTIVGIDSPHGPRQEAGPGQAVTLLLADDLSITRGDMICRPNNRPRSTQELEAMLCWMDNSAPLQPGKIYTIKHTTKVARTKINQVLYRLNISNLHRETGVNALTMNEIGRVTLHTTSPLFFDDYHQNRTTGCFIIVDEDTGQTAAAGMLLSPRTWTNRSGTNHRSRARLVGPHSASVASPCGSRDCRDRASQRSPTRLPTASPEQEHSPMCWMPTTFVTV
jgi:bifunctional enzyme CysN/CysC